VTESKVGTMQKTAMIVGTGPGLGYSLAEHFGKKGFRVILTARREDALKKYQEELKGKGIEAFTAPADAADGFQLESTIRNAVEQFGMPDVLIYNVGITTLDADTHIDADTLVERYSVDVAGAYRCIQILDTPEFARKNGALLVTGGGLALHPHYDYLPLSMDKAALRAMVYAMYPVLQEKGIFLGLVTIMGGIAPGTDFAPERIAEAYWDLYQERNQCEVQFGSKTEG
jgi:short-subunit dehydrogenase